MKYLLPLFACMALTLGCNRYQYFTINSNNALQNHQQEFVVENDSLQILYSFKGENAPVTIRITNKLNKPLAVDWKRSALIVNNQAISYMADKLVTTGSAVTSTFNWNNDWSDSYTRFSSITTLPVEWQLIPPQSYITRTPMGVTNGYFGDIPHASYAKKQIILEDGTPVFVREASFTEERSPLKFRSYLTLMAEGEEKIKPVVLEHSFYVSGVVRTGMGPGQFTTDRAYVKQATGFGTGFGIVAGVAVLGAVAAVSAQTSK